MKQIRLAATTAALAVAVLFSSCKKDDDAVVNANASSTLTAGKAGIFFNTNANFVTNTTFTVREANTTAFSASGAGSRVISLTATEVSSTSAPVREAEIVITLPSASTTTTGNIVFNLATGTSSQYASVSLTSRSGTSNGVTYDSETGTLTITKLTATEIEGSFSGTVSDGTTAYVISNGSFAGKFQ